MKVTIKHLRFQEQKVMPVIDLFDKHNIPRIGDTIRVFHEPAPKVVAVIWDEYLNNVEVIVD